MTDKEKMIEWITNIKYECRHMDCAKCKAYSFEGEDCQAYLIADYLISKGVTIPVRCGGCVHWCEPRIDICSEQKYGDCLRPLGDYGNYIETNADDFCAYGERKNQ